MATLEYVEIDTFFYTSQSAVQPDPQDFDEKGHAKDCDDELLRIMNTFKHTVDMCKELLIVIFLFVIRTQKYVVTSKLMVL